MVSSTDMQSAAASSEDSAIPMKLRDDAIVEALCQIQFQTSDLPEFVIGKLGDESKWKDFKPTRLPWADVPAPIRKSDPNLRAQPILEFRSKDGSRLVRLNEISMSYHVVGSKRYCGWEKFRPELESAFATIFERLKAPEIKRLGFRYINAIIPSRHFISNVHQLNLEVMVNGAKLDGPINLNFVVENGSEHLTTTRIAHKDFVQGTLPEATSAVVDVEVTTPASFSASKLEAVMTWIEAAHGFEKEAFFKLIPPDILRKLKEN